MKRICFVVDSIFSIGGVQRVTAVIATELARTYEVTIITFDDPMTKDTSLYGLSEANISYTFFRYPPVGKLKQKCYRAYSGLYRKLRLPFKWASNLYAHSSFPPERQKALSKALNEGNYNVIIGVHAPLATRLATLRKDLANTNTKLIGWVHNSFEALFSETSLYIGPDRLRHYVYQFMKLDKTILLCEHDKESYHHYDPNFHPAIIYNPLTLTPGMPSKGCSKRFLAVGRFSHLHKGFDILIEAFHILALHDSEWKLDIVGEGPEEMLYHSLINKYKLEERVFIHPFTNRIQEYYSNAQIYVLSSRWEGFGLVLVEAMAHGLPIVSSDLPTSLEIMGDFGIYFKNGNTEDLAQKLFEATQINWPKKSKEAFQIAERFNVCNIIERWKTIIEE